jgi:predicted TIM-barrel fold metal-dependent hydrolase
MRIDVHAHYFSGEYLDLLDRSGGVESTTSPGRRCLWPSPSADIEARFDAMDRAGITLQILSISGVAPYFHDKAVAVTGARLANDNYAELVRTHPGRFAAFATLPMPHVDEALEELRRALDELGAVGVTLSTSVLGMSLADPRFAPIFEELNRRGAVLFIHPAGVACHSPDIMSSGLQWPLGAPFEDTLCAIQLIQAGFPTRYPRMKTILPHLGGTLPMLVHRLDELSRRHVSIELNMYDAVRHFWYDTVNGFPPALRLACDAFGTDRILFGTDYPFWRDEAHQLAMTYLHEIGLSDAEKTAIFEGNARGLFGKLSPLAALGRSS